MPTKEPPTVPEAGAQQSAQPTAGLGPLVVGRPAPQHWVGRASVTPGGTARKRPTLALDVTDQLSAVPPMVVVPERPRGGFRRLLGALLAIAVILGALVVSAYLTYKVASGENPLEWPPTVDYDKLFG